MTPEQERHLTRLLAGLRWAWLATLLCVLAGLVSVMIARSHDVHEIGEMIRSNGERLERIERMLEK